VLVNNAGMSPLYDRIENVTEDLWDKVLDVNLKGPFRLTAMVGARMAAGAGGSIIMVSSTSAIRPTANVIPYAAAKAAVNAMTEGFARAFGPTDIPITYDPPVKEASELAVEREAAEDPELFACWMQKAPARQLVNLKHIPVVVMAAEASYHQVYDHCTAKYLTQAGVKTEYIKLQDKGIRGNGHMVMIEKNNLDIARLLDEWVQKNVR